MMLLYSYMSAWVLDGKTSSSLLIVLDDVDKHLTMILLIQCNICKFLNRVIQINVSIITSAPLCIIKTHSHVSAAKKDVLHTSVLQESLSDHFQSFISL